MEARMVTRSTNGDGLLRSDPIHTPVPAVAAADPWEGWEKWLAARLEAERGEVVEIVGEVVARLRVEIADTIEKRIAPLQRKVDIAPPTLAEIDRRIEERVAAKHQLMIDVSREVVAQLQHDAEMRGPPGPSGPRGEEGPPGKLPIVKLWTPETVYYAGDVVAYDGGTFQAQRDTGQPPSHAHWICLAAAGRDGKTIAVRGTFDQSVSYRCLDIVALNGGSFIALKDAPGPCPGPGWQLIASQGRRGVAGEKGERGERGARGERGEDAAKIASWRIDRARFVATPVMLDGTLGPELELREFFEEFQIETR
jgi:hypothetical protein